MSQIKACAIVSTLLLCIAPVFVHPSLPYKASCISKICLKSTAFKYNNPIPAQFTCEGANISPELHWHAIPKCTKSLVIIIDDPDSPPPFPNPFVHWVVYDLPITCRLTQGANISALFPTAQQGTNNFGNIGYNGPCPPQGDGFHRYHFRLYALNIKSLGLPAGATKAQVTTAMQGHIIGYGQLIGTYLIP